MSIVYKDPTLSSVKTSISQVSRHSTDDLPSLVVKARRICHSCDRGRTTGYACTECGTHICVDCLTRVLGRYPIGGDPFVQFVPLPDNRLCPSCYAAKNLPEVLVRNEIRRQQYAEHYNTHGRYIDKCTPECPYYKEGLKEQRHMEGLKMNVQIAQMDITRYQKTIDTLNRQIAIRTYELSQIKLEIFSLQCDQLAKVPMGGQY